MTRQAINPSTLSTPRGYSHAVSVNAGRTVFVAGQVALDPRGEVVGKGDLRAQAEQVLSNVRAALAAASATFADVVKMNTYIVGYKTADLAVLREVRSRYLPADNPPASTLVGVQALAQDDFLIEIEVIAVVP